MSDIFLFEGTCHCAVGSSVGVNNVKVASILSVDVVMVDCKLVEKER